MLITKFVKEKKVIQAGSKTNVCALYVTLEKKNCLSTHKPFILNIKKNEILKVYYVFLYLV